MSSWFTYENPGPGVTPEPVALIPRGYTPRTCPPTLPSCSTKNMQNAALADRRFEAFVNLCTISMSPDEIRIVAALVAQFGKPA